MKPTTAVSGLLLMFTLCLGSAASADDESSANRLFESSALLIEQYEAISANEPYQYEARLAILRQVRQNLASIIEDHPGSSLAVQLVTEDRAKTLAIADIEAEMAGLEADIVAAIDESSANRLFVSSALLMKQYEVIPAHDPDQYEARLAILRQVRQNLASIIEDHPGSSLAVQLVTEDRAKTLAVADIEAEMARLECIAESGLDDCIAQEAFGIARGIEEPITRDIALIAVVAVQAGAGDVQRALETAKGIEDANRDWALEEIATAQAGAGDAQGALETAKGIEDASRRALALSEVAAAQAGAGDLYGANHTLREAIEIAQGIEDAWVLSGVAAAQAGAGDIAGALETARGIEDAYDRALALSAIAAAQAGADDIEGASQTLREALETARSIENASNRAMALHDVAAAQASAGDFQGALEIAESSEAVFWGARAISHVAAAQAGAGDFQGALEIAESIEDVFWGARALSEIYGAQASAGDVRGALETARGIEDAYDRALALSGIATAQAGAGDIAGASQTLREALETALGIEDASDRTWALSDVAAAQAGAGNIAGALKIAWGNQNEFDRARALEEIGMTLFER